MICMVHDTLCPQTLELDREKLPKKKEEVRKERKNWNNLRKSKRVRITVPGQTYAVDVVCTEFILNLFLHEVHIMKIKLL